MKKINLNFPLIDIAGNPMPGDTAGQCLAVVLWMAVEGDKIKFAEWAKKLYSNESFEIEDSDYIVLKKFITNNKRLYAFSEMQILNLLENQNR